MSKNKVSIYGVGGLGINILKALPEELSIGYAEIVPYYIDTSDSNMRNAKTTPENTYLFTGIDGSGKARSENHEVIAKNTLAILQQCKPEAFSIVIHSASGGSGSVISAGLVSELKKRGEQVVVIMVGSTSCQDEIDNNIKALKTYDLLAVRNKSPITVHYLENSATISRKTIDQNASMAVLALLALFSGDNDELDTADLRNWLKHTKLGNELVSLQFCYSEEGYRDAGTVISVATLARHGSATDLFPLPAYQAVGFLTEHADVDFIEDKPLHFTISSDLITMASKALNTKLKEADTYLSSTIARESLVSKDDTVTDNGIVI